MSAKRLKEVEDIVQVTKAIVPIVGMLLVLTMIMSYLVKLSNASKLAINKLLGMGEETAEFFVGVGNMVAEGIDEAIVTTKELMYETGDDALVSFAPITDSVTELRDTIYDGAYEVFNKIGIMKDETRSKVNVLDDAVKSMIPDIRLGDVGPVGGPVAPKPPPGPDPDLIDALGGSDMPPMADSADEYVGKWSVDWSRAYWANQRDNTEPEYFNIFKKADGSYFMSTDALGHYATINSYVPEGGFKLHFVRGNMFGAFYRVGYETTYYVLKLVSPTEIDWVFFEVDPVTFVQKYDPRMPATDILVRVGGVTFDPVSGIDLF
jgi:hypothetical protein